MDHQSVGRTQHGVEHGRVACINAPGDAYAYALSDAVANTHAHAEHDVTAAPCHGLERAKT